MTDVVLHREIERFRERLLDLSLRNPLLSYRKSKRRTLQVVDQLPNVIFERLVEAGKPLILDPVPDPPVRNATYDPEVQAPALVTSRLTDTDGHEAIPSAGAGKGVRSNTVRHEICARAQQ